MRPRRNGRLPSRFPTDGVGIPLRITRLFPMKLKDVTIKSLEESKKESDLVCMTEMMSLFECLEKHDFDQKLCQQHANALEHCYSSFRAMKRAAAAKKEQTRK